MNKFRDWDEESVAFVKRYLEQGTHSKLAYCMLTTHSSPFQYLPRDWWYALDTGHGFVKLIETMEHTGVWFVLVNKQPRVVFVNPIDESLVLEPNDLALLERKGIIRSTMEGRGIVLAEGALAVEVLNIPSCQFGALQEQHEIKQYKRAFAFDAARYGVEAAKLRSKGTPYCCDSWPEELASEILKYKKAFDAT